MKKKILDVMKIVQIDLINYLIYEIENGIILYVVPSYLFH